jgi:ATP-binding cassette subfamily B (MDR/TAP) protein 1
MLLVCMLLTRTLLGVYTVAAGAAQPLMTLILGRFTTSFTTFATVLIQLSTDPTNEQLRTAFRQAQDAVKADTSRNAIWLTIIGAGNFVAICSSPTC